MSLLRFVPNSLQIWAIGDELERRLIDRRRPFLDSFVVSLRNVLVDGRRKRLRNVIADLGLNVGRQAAALSLSDLANLADLHGTVGVAVDRIVGRDVLDRRILRDLPVLVLVERIGVDEPRAAEAQERILFGVDRLVRIADGARVAVDDARGDGGAANGLTRLADRNDLAAMAPAMMPAIARVARSFCIWSLRSLSNKEVPSRDSIWCYLVNRKLFRTLAHRCRDRSPSGIFALLRLVLGPFQSALDVRDRIVADREAGDRRGIERVGIGRQARGIGILPRVGRVFDRLIRLVAAVDLGDVLRSRMLQIPHLLGLDEPVDQVERRALKRDRVEQLVADLL